MKQSQDQIEQMFEFAKMHDMLQTLMEGNYSQQYCCYFWEQQVLDKKEIAQGSMSPHELSVFVDRVLSAYGYTQKDCPVTSARLSSDTQGCTHYNSQTGILFVEINHKDASKYVVLHELSHALLHLIGVHESQDHGPTFVRVFCELLERFGDIPVAETLPSAKQNGLLVDNDLPKKLVFR